MSASKRKKSRKRQTPSARRRRGFEALEDRRLMAVLTGSSTFDPQVMGDNIEFLSAGNTVGFGYAINAGGTVNAAVGSGGLRRTAADLPVRNFFSTTELEISSVSKTVTATAILHELQSRPGGLDAQLNTLLVDYLPSDWNPGANVQNVTLRHLLTHRSGFLEEGNSINVNFESYGNNTFANLQDLVEAGLPAPTVAADDVYDTPRWGYSYNNANFTLLAKVVLPKLVSPSLDLTSGFIFGRDSYSGLVYKNYVKDNIFDPIGVTGADMETNQADPAMGYNLATADTNSGRNQTDLTTTGGAFGWKLTARELATFLDAIEHDNSILWSSTRTMRDQQELGWFASTDNFGTTYSHNGATGGSTGNFRSIIASFPGDVQAAYLMNNEDAFVGGRGTMLKTAYQNAWTDLTVAGTTGDDNFVLRLNNSGVKPSVEVVLNGQVEFTHWISTLDSVTINGGLGNDTFTIEGWNSSVDLTLNGSWGNDVVHVLPGVKNIEMVSGMTFNGGLGTDVVYVNDQANPYSNVNMSRLYTVSETGVTRFRAHPAQPWNPAMFVPVVISYTGVESGNVYTGGQSDIVNVASAFSGIMNVNTGGGNDVINLGSSLGNLEEFDKTYVVGGSGVDTVHVFDHNKTGSPTANANYDVDDHSVSRYMTDLGGISQGPPTTYDVVFEAENFELTTTDLVDVIRVHSTTTGQTTVNGGAGNDRLYASPDDKNMELVDDLVFNGDAGLDKLIISDQNNPYGFSLSDDYTVTSSRVIRGEADIYLIGSPANINVDYASVEDLTLSTGSQGDTVNVESTPLTRALIQTGAGDDVVNASPADRNMELVDGLEVDGGAGSDHFNVFDQNNPYELPGGGLYTITPDSIGRYEEHVIFDNVAVPIDVQFDDMETVSLAAGNLGDEFNVQGDAGVGTLVLDGNGGADEFNVDGPAFGEIHIQGDNPIFAPGDTLTLNQDGQYPVASVPGIYALGSGAWTIALSTVHYAGIETTDIQQQLNPIPGDFDYDGDVDGVDLTHGTLGWHKRYGHDLGGSSFLTWQRNLGQGVAPVRTNPQILVAPEAGGDDADPDYVALATWGGETDNDEADAVLGWEEPNNFDGSGESSHTTAVDLAMATTEEPAYEADDELAAVAGGELAWDAALASWDSV